jgi:hypothetical protein
MNDVLPKPFTKDSLLGMLEKHLLHMKRMQQMQEMGNSIPTPIKNQRLVELPAESPSHQDPIPSSSHEVPHDLPRLPFSYDQDYSAAFGTPANASAPPFPQQSNIHTSTGKRRTASENDPYEYLDQSRSMPRSAGGNGPAAGKRARYNTPPW